MTRITGSGIRQPLNRERIIRAAVHLVDRDGVEALSMRRLAAELGVEAMSLYNHVPNKAAVLDGVTEAVQDEIDVTVAATGKWEDRVEAIAGEFRRVALAHPNAFILLVTRPVGSTVALRAFDTAMVLLANAGFDTATSVHILRTIVALHTGSVLRELNGGWNLLVDQQQSPELLALRMGELRAGGFPALATAASDLAVCDHEEEYRFGLKLLLIGLRQLLASR